VCFGGVALLSFERQCLDGELGARYGSAALRKRERGCFFPVSGPLLDGAPISLWG
jgi:hypothetical protein